MDGTSFDALAKALARPASRRATLTGLGAADAQAWLDALDADTRSSLAQALWVDDLSVDHLPADALPHLVSQKNSAAGFGERMAAFLRQLIADQDPWTPHNAPRYQTLLEHTAALTPHQAYAMRNLLGPESTRGYQPIPAKADLQFPRNHAVALGTPLGWYFFVGSATGANGKEYGVEMMFFRYALLPPALADRFGLSPTENQVIDLQFAISEVGDHHYQAEPIVVAGTSGLLSFEDGTLGMAMGKNVLRSLQPGEIFPLQLQTRGRYKGPNGATDLGIDLTFASGKEILLQGVDGCLPCCDGVGTLYYSIPHLELDTTKSTLSLKGEEVTLTGGTFWFDHQWGMLSGSGNSAVVRAASNLVPPAAGGWDWFEAQFDGDRQITVAAIHTEYSLAFQNQTGPTPPGTMTVTAQGKYMDPAGTTVDATATLVIDEWLKSADSPDPTQYWPTDVWYPNRWTFTFGPEVPDDIRTFTMVPVVPTGQVGFFASGAQYSEGAVFLQDAAGKTVGRGYAESVSYADTLRNVLALAGVPTTDEMVAQMRSSGPSAELKAASQAYVFTHAAELQQITATCVGLG